VLYTWGRNEHWQLGYEVSGLLNSGQSFDAQPEPAPVPLPEGTARVVDVACGELGTAVLLEDDSVCRRPKEWGEAWGQEACGSQRSAPTNLLTWPPPPPGVAVGHAPLLRAFAGAWHRSTARRRRGSGGGQGCAAGGWCHPRGHPDGLRPRLHVRRGHCARLDQGGAEAVGAGQAQAGRTAGTARRVRIVLHRPHPRALAAPKQRAPRPNQPAPAVSCPEEWRLQARGGRGPARMDAGAAQARGTRRHRMGSTPSGPGLCGRRSSMAAHAHSYPTANTATQETRQEAATRIERGRHAESTPSAATTHCHQRQPVPPCSALAPPHSQTPRTHAEIKCHAARYLPLPLPLPLYHSTVYCAGSTTLYHSLLAERSARVAHSAGGAGALHLYVSTCCLALSMLMCLSGSDREPWPP